MDKREEMLAWSGRLRELSGRTLGERFGSVRPGDFRDEQGNSREVDRLLVEWATKGPKWWADEIPVTPERRAFLTTPFAAAPEVRLWRALLDTSVPIEPAIAPMPDPNSDSCPVVAQAAGTAIEVWTEVELSGVHALWWYAHNGYRPEYQYRLRAAVSYLLEHIQPDNATQHAWAVHAFLHDWIEHGRVESKMFADTLIHACTIERGRPDLVSAWALLDASRAMEVAAEDPKNGPMALRRWGPST